MPDVAFPTGSTLEERILLIAATLYVNLMYVEHRNRFVNNIALTKHLLQWLWVNPLFVFRNAQTGLVV